MKIGRKDLFWNYAATSMRILSGILVLPLSLRMLPSEEMGLWSIFLSLVTITSLLDFGFANSFSRNVSYIYGGANELRAEGCAETGDNCTINYGLLKSVLSAIKYYYGFAALLFLVVFLIASPFYMSSVLEQYSGDKQSIWIAWYLFGAVMAYELYTYYFTAILMGRGLVKRNMQIVVLSQSIRIIITLVLLLFEYGIISLVLGMLVGDVVNRALSHFAFFDKETKKSLSTVVAEPAMKIIKIMAPNSVKIGLVSLGAFLLSHVLTLITPFYLTLSEVAEYGISKQLINLIISLSLIFFNTFYAKFSAYRVKGNNEDIKRIYIKSTLNMLLIFLAGGAGLLLFGNKILILIKSNTMLLGTGSLFLMLLFALLETNQAIAASTLLTKNEVPHFKANLISGVVSLLVLFVMLHFTSWGVLCFILAPGLTMCAYQNWKWPSVVSKELSISVKDYCSVIKSYV